jgi:hypothetical protein
MSRDRPLRWASLNQRIEQGSSKVSGADTAANGMVPPAASVITIQVIFSA